MKSDPHTNGSYVFLVPPDTRKLDEVETPLDDRGKKDKNYEHRRRDQKQQSTENRQAPMQSTQKAQIIPIAQRGDQS